MKRKIAALLLGILGLGVLLYPVVSNAVSRFNGSYAIAQLSAQMEKADREELRRQRELAEEYNESLSCTFEENPMNYAAILDFGNGIMGYLQVPKIRVELPIYHGVEEAVLAKGVGHLPGSALPIGGEGNHAVLSGHTGLPEARLFTDLVELELGDLFQIRILEQTLTYRVDQIKTVLPNEGEDLAPIAGLDLCTLVTCTPYGINSHRLLVRGVRVPEEAEDIRESRQQTGEKQESTLAPWLVLLTVPLLWWMIRKWKKKER